MLSNLMFLQSFLLGVESEKTNQVMYLDLSAFKSESFFLSFQKRGVPSCILFVQEPKIAIFVIHFGKWTDEHEYVMKSAERSKYITWFVFSDSTPSKKDWRRLESLLAEEDFVQEELQRSLLKKGGWK